MTKKQELEMVKNQALSHQNNAKYWCEAYESQRKTNAALVEQHKKELAECRASMFKRMEELTKASCEAIEKTALKTERDTMAQAFKYVADRLTQGE